MERLLHGFIFRHFWLHMESGRSSEAWHFSIWTAILSVVFTNLLCLWDQALFWSDTYTDRDRSGFNSSYSLDVKAYPYGARTLHSRCQSKCSKISGLKVEKSVILGFMLSGALAALAGIVYLGRLGAAEAEIGNQFHFQCVSAVAIGGISFAGGAGSAWGAVIGALILNILINGMNLLNISSYWQGTVNGVIIIIAVLLDYTVRKKQTK